jgi:hypothetical protein
MTITADDMKPKLHTLDFARGLLARTEPLAALGFNATEAAFTVQPGWNHGIDAKAGTEPVDATIRIPGGEYPLTKDALLEATSIVGLTKTYAARCPAGLLAAQLNYWFTGGGIAGRKGTNKEFQLLAAAGNGAAVTRSSIIPFSNLRLLDVAEDVITQRYGPQEILVDYKLTHSLRRTHLRLVLPGIERTMDNTGTPDDTWSVGLQLRNSLTGEERTAIEAYLFRWVCTNGQIDTRASSDAWRRHGAGRGSEAEVYEWARTAVDDVLSGLEPALDAVQALADIPVTGTATDVLRDVFEHYKVPLPERAKIIENVVNTGGDLTMYAIMAAVTQVANDTDMEPSHVENLLRLGGDLPHAATSRCDACRRLMPNGD